MAESQITRIEIDLPKLRKNLQLIRQDMPANLSWCSVLKDQAYGHGAIRVAKETIAAGASSIAVATLNEALELKSGSIQTPIMIFGERPFHELETCIENDFLFFVNDFSQARIVNEIGKKHGRKIDVHVKIDTGLSRYGVRWEQAATFIQEIQSMSHLRLAGIMTHFAMSDELDKTFANEQIQRFEECIDPLRKSGAKFHACNTGGYLDLPKAHYDFVRIGILPLGVYPSKVCRRIPGIEPIMSFHTQIASIKKIEKGDIVGYGLRYKAENSRTIAVLPVGYSSGFPRLRNKGHVLVHGKRAPIIGGNSMNAMMIDVTDIPQTKSWDDVVLVGKQGEDEISIHDLATWDETVSYEIMTRFSWSVPRIYK